MPRAPALGSEDGQSREGLWCGRRHRHTGSSNVLQLCQRSRPQPGLTPERGAPLSAAETQAEKVSQRRVFTPFQK